ncbi:MAG: nucleoside triphosphate pyrophosphohydrolase family protein [Anaerolineae bacterium]|nr:nucleoside triphosphate pyrophosphohydrolase family protein [Anaerolineae bacterium]
MDMNEYQRLALRTAGHRQDVEKVLIYTALGLTGESGEVAEMIKKAFFHAHPLDKEKLSKELGDVLWYLAVMADGLGIPLEQIAQENVDKLRQRYPEGFSEERSLNRVS